MARKARGTHAFGYCDRTGFRYPLEDLIPEYVQGNPTGLRVGRDVHDKDHPQNWIGKKQVREDPQALNDPRIDLSEDDSRRLFSFDPVGLGNMSMVVGVGRVTFS